MQKRSLKKITSKSKLRMPGFYGLTLSKRLAEYEAQMEELAQSSTIDR